MKLSIFFLISLLCNGFLKSSIALDVDGVDINSTVAIATVDDGILQTVSAIDRSKPSSSIEYITSAGEVDGIGFKSTFATGTVGIQILPYICRVHHLLWNTPLLVVSILLLLLLAAEVDGVGWFFLVWIVKVDLRAYDLSHFRHENLRRLDWWMIMCLIIFFFFENVFSQISHLISFFI
jgi:hypothetical protein